MKTVQVSSVRESATHIGCLVDLLFDENGRNTSASRIEWFPKSDCSIRKVPPFNPKTDHPSYFLTAPESILDKKKVKYEV